MARWRSALHNTTRALDKNASRIASQVCMGNRLDNGYMMWAFVKPPIAIVQREFIYPDVIKSDAPSTLVAMVLASVEAGS